MKLSTMWPTKYITAGDLPQDGSGLPCRIERVVIENPAPDGEPIEQKPVVYFVGGKKGLVLNKTNGYAIGEAFGEDTDDWVNKAILLVRETTEYQGKRVPCVRVRVSQPAPVQPPPTPAEGYNPGNGGTDDELPF